MLRWPVKPEIAGSIPVLSANFWKGIIIMEQDLQNYYKLTLAHDLILFLMHVQNDGLSKDQQAQRTNKILEAWEKRVDTKVQIMADENIKEISKASGEDEDVLKIIQEAHTAEPKAIRKEFKREVRSIVFKSLDKTT